MLCLKIHTHSVKIERFALSQSGHDIIKKAPRPGQEARQRERGEQVESQPQKREGVKQEGKRHLFRQPSTKRQKMHHSTPHMYTRRLYVTVPLSPHSHIDYTTSPNLVRVEMTPPIRRFQRPGSKIPKARPQIAISRQKAEKRTQRKRPAELKIEPKKEINTFFFILPLYPRKSTLDRHIQ